ncbi:hypothetical protein GIB67_029437 [Kingdonia uniflora]|uniref:Cytochrome P450 n=1 Tax=Kingdonia uniflora TaxID=39325 RepID=A0A7J7NXW9_9MAGN|nr:hypothetical protein GIB67_029437 [Kingdonia uniflora]
MRNTKVIAVVYGPREVQNWSQQINDKALVRYEYNMANFSTGDRMRKQKGDRRYTEISLVIRQTVEACILTHLMPCSQIYIFVQVLQADGGTRSACINAATLAVADAGIPTCYLVTSCSAGYLNSTPLLDLNYVEDSVGGVDVTVGIPAKFDKVTLIQMDVKLPMDTFENITQFTVEGCKEITNYIREVHFDCIYRDIGALSSKESKLLAGNHSIAQVIQETLRTSSIISFTLREAVENVELEGLLIPKGWKVIPLFRAIHHPEKIYPEHEKFNPSLFEAQPRPNTYLPFGIGGYSCPGSELAKLEMLVFLYHLTNDYRWKVVGEEEGIHYGSFPVPKGGLTLKITHKEE